MQCEAIKTDGERCRCGIVGARGLCYSHDPARERFLGPEFHRLARAEWLVQDAISFRIEHARRGRLEGGQMDRYTKLLLTVIALALVWIAASPSVPAALADAIPSSITCVVPQQVDMNIAAVGGKPLEGRIGHQTSVINSRVGLPMFVVPSRQRQRMDAEYLRELLLRVRDHDQAAEGLRVKFRRLIVSTSDTVYIGRG